MSSAFSEKSLQGVCPDSSGSLHSSIRFPEPASGEGAFNHSGLPEASGPCLPKAPSLGTGPALLLPNLLTSGIRVDRKIQSTEHTHSRTGCPVGERAIARESQGNGQSSAQIDTIHELCHLFPIIGKRKNYSINHDEKMSCFGGKGGGA